MKKLIMFSVLFLAGAGIASADGLSISFGFGDDCYRPRRAYYRPAYYYDDCGPRYYRSGYYRPYRRSYYSRDYYRPQRRVVVYRDCD